MMKIHRAQRTSWPWDLGSCNLQCFCGCCERFRDLTFSNIAAVWILEKIRKTSVKSKSISKNTTDPVFTHHNNFKEIKSMKTIEKLEKI